MALTMRRSPREYLDRAGRVHADARTLVATPAHAERRVGLRGSESTNLDVARDADAAIVAAGLRLGAALFEALLVGHREGPVERRPVSAAGVGATADGRQGERVRWHERLAPALGGGHAR